MGSTSGSAGYYTSRCSLPSAWETRVIGSRNQQAMTYLRVEGTRVRYVGPGDEDSQAATIRANYPVPADCPLYYFEVTVVDRGQEGFIGLGFCTDEVLLSRLPGWDAHSYGYHGDDGCAFSGSGAGRPYGPKYGTGDVVGALYDKAARTISYYKNGEALGPAFRDVNEASALYPCIGLRTRGEEVTANFGTGPGGPFRADFSCLKETFQQRVSSDVRSMQLPLLSSRGTPLLPQLMYDYLLHQRYWRTASVLGRDLLCAGGRLGEAELSDIAVRQQSYDLVAAGRIEEAVALVREKFPLEVLSSRPSLEFRLHVQVFVEMVAAAHGARRAAASGGDGARAAGGREQEQEAKEQAGAEAGRPGQTGVRCGGKGGGGGSGELEHMGVGEGQGKCKGKGAGEEGRGEGAERAEGGGSALATATAVPSTRDILDYGRKQLQTRCCTAADRDVLQDALSLLAFDDPAACPAAYLLRPSHKVALAEELNGALLAARGLPATSPLERLYQQAAAVLTELKRADHPQALALPDARAMILEPPPPPMEAGGGGGGGGADGGGVSMMVE